MADSDKDILITPNTGAATDPSIVFSSGATGGDDVTLFVTDDGTITTLSIEGSAGQLFSVSNDLTGVIFSVNDISGIPSLEVNADGTVSIAEFDGDVGIGTSSPSAQLHVIADSATTNADIPVLRITSTSTGTPATGIGPSIEFESETAAGAPGNLEIGGVLAIEATDVTSTSEDFDFVFSTMAAGAAAAERMRISSAGTVTATSFSGANVTSGADPGHTHTSSSITSVSAANISAGSLATGVNSYFTASATASAFKVPFMNYTGTASTNAGLLHDSSASFTYNPSTNDLTIGGQLNAGTIDSSGTITASSYFKTDASNANGYGFWNGAPTTYGIFMSQSSVQGRIGGETTSDYNQYFEMNSGTNRGFVFETDGTKLFAVNPDGVRSAVALTVTGTMAATTVTGANVTSGADPGHTHGAGSVPNHDSLTGFVANEHIDWTADSGSQIQVDNLAVDRSYSGVSTVTPQYSYVGYDRFSGGIDNDLILDAGIFGLASGDTNGAGNGTFNPMLVMRNSSDVRVQVSFPRENSNPIAYRGYHTAAWQTWHYAGWTTTEANANLDATFAKISGTPVNNQLGVWTSATQIEGDANLIWDGTILTVGGVLHLIERADHSTSPSGGRGEVWVKSGSLGGELMYTEGDQDNDFTVYNVLPVTYHHDQTTTAADPGAGNMRWNSTTPASVTNVYLNDTDETGRDNSFMLGNLADGDILTMRNMWASGGYFVASVNGAPTDNTGWWTIPVTVIHSGTVPSTGAPVHISVEWMSQAPGGGGITGTVANDQVVTGTGASTVDSSANLTFNGSTLAVTGNVTATTSSTFSGGIAMSNANITAVGALSFNDPGPGEGISWTGGNWSIYDSPDDLVTNTAGNLQFVTSGTRMMTVGTDGIIDINKEILIGADATQPWISVDSTSSGDNWSAQGAGISVGESGKKGSAAIHLTYNGDGSGYLGMGTVDDTAATGGRPTYGHLDFTYNSRDVKVGGLLYPGNSAGTTGSSLVQSVAYIESADSQNYGSINVTGAAGSSGTYSGYSINRRVVFMNNNSTTSGFYNDTNNEWMITMVENGAVSLYHNNVINFATQVYSTTGNTSGAYVRDHANVTRDVGFNHVKEISMTTSNITLDDIHAGCIIRRTGTSAVTLTVAAGTAFPNGSMVTVLNHGTGGSLTISDGAEAMYIMDGSGTVTDSAGFALAIGGCITIWRQGTSAFYVWGAGIP